MWNIDEKTVDDLREQYPEGSTVELIYMDDFQAPPIGTRGKVICVDDLGTVHVEWETGSTLGLVYGKDTYRKVPEQEVINDQDHVQNIIEILKKMPDEQSADFLSLYVENYRTMKEEILRDFVADELKRNPEKCEELEKTYTELNQDVEL